MLMYIFLTAVCVALAFFVNTSYRRELNTLYGKPLETALPTRQETINRCMLAGIFIVLFLLSAMRYGIGNDYWTYRQQFINIDHADTAVSSEIGFVLFVRLMQFIFGAERFIPIFAVIAFFTCLFFVKGLFDTSDMFVMSFFLFMANGFYFMSFSNIRYYFALSLVIFSMKYLFGRKFVKFCLIILFASLFHMTALLVIPAYFIAFYLKWSKKTVWLIPVAAAVLVFAKIPIRWLLFKFYPYYEGDAILDVTNLSFMNIAKCAVILIFCLVFYKKSLKGNEKAEMFFNLNLFALLLYTCATYVPELSRVCYYLIIGQVFLIPIILKNIASKKLRIILTCGVCAAYSGYFLLFLKQGYDPVIQILPYFSWVFI